MGKRKNQVVYENVEVVDAGSEGMAVGKVNERVIFIPFVVPGDVVDVKVYKKRKGNLFAKAINFHRYSEKRITAKCEHFGICGGCKWQNMPYADQLHYKQKQVNDNLQRIGKVDVGIISPIIPSDDIYYYRNKLEYTFSDRKWVEDPRDIKSDTKEMPGLGFHLPGFYDKILDINHCYLQNDPSNDIRIAIRDFAIENDFGFYNVKKQEGLLRNLIIRNTALGEWMVIMVFHLNDEAKIRAMMDFIKERFPELQSLMYVINEKKNDDISDREVILYSGKPFIMEELTDTATGRNLSFKIGPLSFFQTNSRQGNKLYDVVKEFAGLKGRETVYDLYTGTGTIANFVAADAGKVYGIEYIPSAIEDAKENSKINAIENTHFTAGDIANILDDEFIDKTGKPEVILTDPPRAGMHPKVVKRINESGAEKIVYVSCNPATQARDILMMKENYRVEKIQPVDMFPHTAHVENVVLLRKIMDT